MLIMKDFNNLCVNRTRPIPLKESDANENAKRMAKDVSVVAERYNLVAAEQYSKLHGSAIYLATNKRLACDISSQIKQPMSVCSNNTRSFYDRIIHVAAFLDLGRFGIPKPMIFSTLHMIQKWNTASAHHSGTLALHMEGHLGDYHHMSRFKETVPHR